MPVYTSQLVTSVLKAVKEYKGAALNLVIVAGTIVLNTIVQNEIFYCPCVNPIDLGDCKSTSEFRNTSARCTQRVNFYYGVAFIVFPAIALFFIGLLAMPRLWKIITGCLRTGPRQRKRKAGILSVLFASIVRAFLAPFTWLMVMLLDGKYLSCALTPLPYDVGKGRSYATCTAVSQTEKARMSDAFNTNVIVSQILGWCFLAVIVCAGFCAYVLVSSTSQLTYYHAKYFKIYKENEEYEIDDEMKIKAQKDAEANVRKFMEERREKEDWDEISQIYQYHKDKKNLSVYSYLHQWVLEKRMEEANLLSEEDSPNLDPTPDTTSATTPLIQ